MCEKHEIITMVGGPPKFKMFEFQNIIFNICSIWEKKELTLSLF